MDLESLNHLFKTHKEAHLFGRYINGRHLAPLIQIHAENFEIKTIGTSVLGEPIYVLIVGSGLKKVLMWSQMHGNESTTTKALFDVLNVFANDYSKDIKKILDDCTIAIIPMLNPDGAKSYTRVNANQIDLNRDAQNLTQPESCALRTFFDSFKPDFCFNLHGQRTIFSTGDTKSSATVSFLAPAQDKHCTLTDNRRKAMEIIIRMNEYLQQQIPNQVGRYDDAFNLDCVGDTFQSLNVPTILFEAGHYHNDYNREEVRGLIFQSLLIALHHITSPTITDDSIGAYEEIPQNQKLFYDIIIRNARFDKHTYDIAIQYQEKLIEENIQFIPIVDKISDLKDFYGHKEVEAHNSAVLTLENHVIYEGYENDFVLLNNELFSLKV